MRLAEGQVPSEIHIPIKKTTSPKCQNSSFKASSRRVQDGGRKPLCSTRTSNRQRPLRTPSSKFQPAAPPTARIRTSTRQHHHLVRLPRRNCRLRSVLRFHHQGRHECGGNAGSRPLGQPFGRSPPTGRPHVRRCLLQKLSPCLSESALERPVISEDIPWKIIITPKTPARTPKMPIT